jgi:DNA modification methylase
MQVVAISLIKPNPSNPRLIKDDKFHKLVQSLKDFPEMANVRPIVVNQDMIILGGNMRFKAMKEAKWKEVPVQVVDWDEAKQREFIIKDNVGFGEWDWDDLANNWDAEELEAWGLDVPAAFIEEDEAQEDDYEIPDEIQTDIVLGDLFEIGEHRLLCGDSTDSDSVAKLMNGQNADMVLTDPPYNLHIGITKENKKTHERIKNIIDFNPNEFLNNLLILGDVNCYIFCNISLVSEYLNFAKDNNCTYDILVWHKKQVIPFHINHHLSDIEYIIKISNSKKFNGKLDIDYSKLYQSNKGENDLHPTMKPIELLKNLILISSDASNYVFDLFLGSGSTMVAAHQLKRKCYGMELDPKYCQVIVDRMLKLDPTLKIKRNGQPYLTEGTNQRENTDATARECHTA